MAGFDTLDWMRFDVWAIVASRGIVGVESAHLDSSRRWLDSHGYAREEFGFDRGISPVVARLNEVLAWPRQFGYELQPGSRNLDALRDGFEFDVPEDGGLALVLRDFEIAFAEDTDWSLGLLSIIAETSLHNLALGRRFFAIAEISGPSSTLSGAAYDEFSIRRFWRPYRTDPFQDASGD